MLLLGVGGAGGHAAADELAGAEAEGGADLVDASGGHAVGLERRRYGGVQVLEGVEQGPVEVEDDRLVCHGSSVASVSLSCRVSQPL